MPVYPKPHHRLVDHHSLPGSPVIRQLPTLEIPSEIPEAVPVSQLFQLIKLFFKFLSKARKTGQNGGADENLDIK